MYPVILGFHIFVCVLLIIAILLQSGKGSSLSEAFGGVSPANVMNKITTILVIIFFFTSIALTLLSTSGTTKSITDKIPTSTIPLNSEDGTKNIPLESK